MREETTPILTPARTADSVAPANGSAANGAAKGATAGAANGEVEIPPWADFSPAMGRFVRFVVVFSVALTLLAAASIYWRSANVYEPTSYLTVQGNESFNGTLVTVTSPDFPEAMATLTKDNDYIAAIFLHPGSYTVTATLNGQALARAPFVITGRKTASLNLAAKRPAAAPPAHAS
jgi:hypothetical protein